MKLKPTYRTSWYIFPAYLSIFLLLFLQFPLNNSLPGKVDTLFFLTAFETINNYLITWFTSAEIGTALYPETAVYPFGNYSFAQALFYLPFRWLGLQEIISYYLFTVLLFTTNALAVYIFSSLWLKKWLSRFGAGLVFAMSNFSFGNLDNPDALFVSLGIVAVYFLWRALTEKRYDLILVAGILASLEVYFSSYGFLFTVLLMLIIIVYQLRALRQPELWKWALPSLVLFLVIIIPYCRVYIFHGEISASFNPGSSVEAAGAASLKWVDLMRPLKYNLIYAHQAATDYNWIYKAKSAFIGILFPVLGFVGLISHKHRWFFVMAIFSFIMLAFGPEFGVSGIKSPLYLLYSECHIQQFMRISVRAWLFAILILSVGVFVLLERHYADSGFKRWLIPLVTILILIENTPRKFEYYNSFDLLHAEIEVESEQEIILNLPSSFYSGFIAGFDPLCIDPPRTDYEFEIIREYLYMFQQTKHRAYTINGFTGFIPNSRMANQRLILDITTTGSLEELILKNDLTSIWVHLDWFNGCPPDEVLRVLKGHPMLEDEQLFGNKIRFRVRE